MKQQIYVIVLTPEHFNTLNKIDMYYVNMVKSNLQWQKDIKRYAGEVSKDIFQAALRQIIASCGRYNVLTKRFLELGSLQDKEFTFPMENINLF